MNAVSSTTWNNWAGNEQASATSVSTPDSVEAVVRAVERARSERGRVKMMGTGHSFTAIAAPEGAMLRPQGLQGIVSVDREAMTVTARAGTQLKNLNVALEAMGLSLHNMGDIAEQTLAGATQTGTHGSGGRWAGLAPQMAGFQIVTGTGEVLRASATENPELFALGRVGLGALGVVTEVTFRVEPAFLLRAEEKPISYSQLVTDFEDLQASYDHLDMHWFPHTEAVLFKGNTRIDDPVESATPPPRWRAWLDDELLSNTVFGLSNKAMMRFPSITATVNSLSGKALSARTYTDLAHRVFVSTRDVRFKEMEYAVPREAGIAVLQEARRIIDANRWNITFPIEVRTAPADDVAMSTGYGRDSLYLAFHVYADADHTAYFAAMEDVLAAHQGRPHWGKMNTRTAADLAAVYPRFEEFLALRERMDPERLFSNAYLRRVLGD